MRSPGRRGRFSWWTFPRNSCGSASRTARSSLQTGSMPRSPTTTARATWQLCVSWPCCGWRTGWTRDSQGIGQVSGIEASWPARERIVVGLPGGPEGQALIRRGARILNRVNGGDLLAVHVRAAETAAAESAQELEAQRRLVQDLGGSYHLVAGEDPAAALLDFARSVNATQIVVGISRRGRLAGLLAGLRRRPHRRQGGPRRGCHRRSHHVPAARGRKPGCAPAAGSGPCPRYDRFCHGCPASRPAAAPAGGQPGQESGDNRPGPAHRLRRRGAGRRTVARDPRGALEQPAGELLLHPAGGHPDHQRFPERARPPGVCRGVRRSRHRGGPLRAAFQGSGPRQGGGRHPRGPLARGGRFGGHGCGIAGASPGRLPGPGRGPSEPPGRRRFAGAAPDCPPGWGLAAYRQRRRSSGLQFRQRRGRAPAQQVSTATTWNGSVPPPAWSCTGRVLPASDRRLLGAFGCPSGGPAGTPATAGQPVRSPEAR